MHFGKQQIRQFNKLLTISLILLLIVTEIRADLAPKEDDDTGESMQQNPSEDHNNAVPPSTNNLGFIHAFIASFSVIIVSEIGDKTFFIACIMSMVS